MQCVSVDFIYKFKIYTKQHKKNNNENKRSNKITTDTDGYAKKKEEDCFPHYKILFTHYKHTFRDTIIIYLKL